MKKKSTLVHFMCVLLCVSAFAEPDNGKFLPNAEPLLPTHVFIEAGGGLNFPVNFFNQSTIAMTSYGGDFFAGVGYNFSGWLTSIHYTHDMWGQGKGDYALMENFKNNILELRIRKIISKQHISWFPKMLEMVPGFGLGVNFITTDYYPSVRAKEQGRMNQVKLGDDGASCFFYRAGLEFALNGITDLFIPFIGCDYNAFYDTSIGGGFAGFPRVYAGIRSYPFGFISDIKRNKAERYAKMISEWPEPTATIKTAMEADFTPDGDGFHDVAIFELRTEYLENDPESWKVSIYNSKNSEIKHFEGKGKLPSQVEWDGKSESGELVFSRNEYNAVLSVIPAEQDKNRTGCNELTSTETVKTGILFEEIIPKKQWKIIVNTIYFDPDRETFEKISDEQKRENKETLESITRQILAHGDVEVIVEGYANNVSNTEEENIRELIPLSRLRAQTIVNLLVENGLSRDILSFEGKGGSNPIAKWEDRENWWKNRRVEFIVTKKE
ncbi:MAG: OmpA family protein [Treponema sp.]|nr:OmpA family protein [Treponema sp.]